MYSLNFLSDIAKYQPGQHVISKDLKVETKSSLQGRWFFQKFVDFFNGTYNAQKTAQAIQQHITVLLGKESRISPSLEQLKTAKEKLTDLNRNLKLKGKLNQEDQVLDKTIVKIEAKIRELEEKQKPRVQPQQTKPTTILPPNVAQLATPQKTAPKAKVQPAQPSETLAKPKETKTTKANVTNEPKQEKNQKSTPAHSASISLPKTQPERSPELAKQLEMLQEQMNHLNPQSNFKQDAGKILLSLEKIKKIDPTYAEQLVPLVEIMQILQRQGTGAFKLDAFQQLLIETCNPQYRANPQLSQSALSDLLRFLRTPKKTNLSIADHWIQKASQVKSEWEKLEAGIFENLLRSPDQVKFQNAMTLRKELLPIYRKLHQNYESRMAALEKNYPKAVLELISKHYPNDDIRGNQQEIVLNLMKSLMKEILKPPLQLTSSINSKILQEKISSLYPKKLSTIKNILNGALEKYNWWNDHIDNIIVPYDQSADHTRNQGDGTCLPNSLGRHQQLAKNPKIETKELNLGSSEKGRVNQARMNAAKLFSADTPAAYNQFLGEIGFGQAPQIKHQTLTNSPDGYQNLVNTLIPTGKPLLGMLAMTYTDPSTQTTEGHVFNIQIDHKNGKFRMIDDNVAAMEFTSPDELKTSLVSYLKVFYPDYTNFDLIIPTSTK